MNILPTAYFGRKVSITVKQPGGSSELTLGALRVVFSVSKKRGENIATLTIYNPNDVTAAEFIPKAIVTIEAGYSDFVGTIYSGEIIEVKRGREDLDRTICIKCRGGASELKKGTFSFSFSKGASAVGILRDLGARVGVPLDIFPDGLTDKPYSGGWAFMGTYYDALIQVAARVGGEVIADDGSVRIQAVGTSNKTIVQAPILSAGSGLKGTPERIEDEDGDEEKKKKKRLGYSFESFLDSRIAISTLLVIEAVVIPGGSCAVVVEEIEHSGDTEGDWTTKGKGYIS